MSSSPYDWDAEAVFTEPELDGDAEETFQYMIAVCRAIAFELEPVELREDVITNVGPDTLRRLVRLNPGKLGYLRAD
jgi:hypothetical protein